MDERETVTPAERVTGEATHAMVPVSDESVGSIAPPEPERVGASMRTNVGVGFGLALGAVAVGSFVVFRLMNRVKVDGLENVPAHHENVLYCLNHNSMLDNFAFESIAYMPRVFFDPDYLPVNLADRKNFFGDPSSRRFKDRVLRALGKHFFTHLRAYPVDRNSHDLTQVDEWAKLLEHNIVVVFPEGTRSRSGAIGRGRAGVGKLIYIRRPTVIPVRMTGTENVLGIGRHVPRPFNTVHVTIGRPLDLSDLYAEGPSGGPDGELDFYRAISARVVEAIKGLTPKE